MTKVFRFGECPLVKVRRVLETEPGQKVIAIKFNGIRQKRDSNRDVMLRVSTALGKQRFKLMHIQGYIGLWIHLNGLPICKYPAFANRLLYFPQCMSQVRK